MTDGTSAAPAATRPRRWARRAGFAALSFVALAPLLAEAVLRASFRFEGAPTRDPALYAEYEHDDFWILKHRWAPEERRVLPGRVHPTRGWSQVRVAGDNPLGLYQRSLDQLQDQERPKVLFYGDSYVAGMVRGIADMIPCYLDDRLPDTDVVHLGVAGYGTGQSYLMMRETIGMAERPLVIMSAMVADFGRAALRVRDAQKPRLVLEEDGALRVTNVPIDADPRRYFRGARLSFRSFALAALRTRFAPETTLVTREKAALNRAILGAVRDTAAENGARLLFVLFHPPGEFVRPDARSEFFVRTCEELGIECLDTRDALTRHMESTGAKRRDLYREGHHDERGNRVIGEALLARLRELGLE
ncbi:MAG: hypothetical protein AAGB93_18705 [Planctomycetota bacterium]